MTLDELFNNAKNGTQDAGYEEGHVSHRKNGDFIKQGGTWVPMKGQKQEGAEKTEAGADEQTMRQSLINFMTKGAPHTTEADAKKAVENLDPETLNQMFEGLKEQYGDKFLAKQEEAAPDYDKEKMDREDEKHEAARKDAEERNASEGQPNTTQSSAAELKLWEKSAKTDAKLSGENQVIFQDANGNCVMYAEGDSDGEAKAEAHGYKKMSLVRPDGSVKRHQGNNPEPTLASTFEAAKNNGWEETQMASGKLWDSPDGKQRIVERKDPESGESKYVLRPKSASDPAPDKSFNSLEEAFEAAKNGGEAPAHKAVDNTTGSNFKEGQRVPNAGALEKTYKHREKQYLDAHRKEAEAHPKEVTERREILASLVANARKQAAMFDAVNGMGDGEGQEWEINSHVAESLNKLNQEEKTLQAKLDELKNPKENKSESRKITPPKIDDIKGYGMEGADKKFYDAGFKPNGWDEEKRISKWKSPDGQEYGIHLDKFGYADEIIKLKTTGGKRDISAENRAYHERVEKERAERKASAQQSAQTAAQEAKQKGYTGETLKDFMLSKTYEGSSVSVTQRGMEAQGWSLTKGEDGLNIYEKPDGSKVTMQLEGNKVKSAEYQPAGSTGNSGVKINSNEVEIEGVKIPKNKINFGGINPTVHVAVMEITGGPDKGSRILGSPNIKEARKYYEKNGGHFNVHGEDLDAAEIYMSVEGDEEAENWFFNTYKDQLKEAAKKSNGGATDEAPLITAQSVNAPGDSFKKKITGDCKVKLSKIKR